FPSTTLFRTGPLAGPYPPVVNPLILVVIAAAIALAAGTYLGLERLGRRGLVPMAARAVAWAAIGILLLTVSCPRPPEARRPLVLLDASLSMDGAGGHWDSALASARRLGDVRYFGDDRGDQPAGNDSLPVRGRSALAPALTAAAASVRPVVVLTDGELDDVRDLPV